MPYDSEGFLAPAIAKPTTTADILDAAADLISQPGRWTQGILRRRQLGIETYCMIGAINEVTSWDPNPYDHPAAVDAAELLGFPDTGFMAQANDTVGQHTAVELLRKAAKLARESEAA